MRNAALLLALGALSACAHGERHVALSSEQISAACEVLEGFLLSEFEDTDLPVHLMTGNPRSGYLVSEAGTEQANDDIYASQEAPLPRDKLREMLRGVRTAQSLDPFDECPNVERLRQKRSHPLPAPLDLSEFEDTNGGNYGLKILQVTIPYVDLARGEAYFSASRTFASLDGADVDVMYVRDRDGNWQPDGESMTSIS